MGWKQVAAGLALAIAGVVGCARQCFLHECDADDYLKFGPANLECDPTKSIVPATAAVAVPSTVNDPDRKLRFLTLKEAMALALENGRVGPETPDNVGGSNFPGAGLNTFNGSDALIQFNINSLTGTDSIRVLSLDPAILATSIESSLSKFDAQWTSSMTWNTSDQPFNGTNFFNSGSNTATFNTALLKPLPTGGVTGITFSTTYQDLTNSRQLGNLAPINPSYTPRLQFQFEQPLLQGFGVEINQLRPSHPGSILTPFPTGLINANEGILITRLRFDEQRAEFQKLVHFMLLNVEIGYWNLYGQYWNLYAQEAALRQAYEAWKINKARYESGRIAVQEFAQTRQQYELFRGQRLAALANVLEAERALRTLLGLPIEDGTRLVPIDSPTLTPYQPDWNTAVNECLAMRPELVLARQDLKANQLSMINAKNLLLPDLRFTSTYALSGIGTSLDGGGTENALRSMASDRFNDWSVGLRLTYQIGYRDAHANLRRIHLNLGRSYKVLQDQEEKAMSQLELRYRHIFEFHQQIEIQRSNREASAQELQARYQDFLAGRGTLDILLEAQRKWAVALGNEYNFIALYNNALAGFEFAKGTILQYNNVAISEGPLPSCAQVRAVEHERERSLALVCRERELPAIQPACDWQKGCLGLPPLPNDTAPPVAALPVNTLFQERAPLPPEPAYQLPSPRKGTDFGSSSNAAPPGTGTNSAGNSLPDAPRVLPSAVPDAAQALRSLSQTPAAPSTSSKVP
jgi:outer membrane protein TolC